MCLLFDIETTFPCCTRTDLTLNDGSNQCDRGGDTLRNAPCASYAPDSTRVEAANAVELFAGLNNNGGFNNDNSPFYDAFTVAWNKATTNGLSGLQPLVGIPTASPSSSPTVPQAASLTNSPSASPTGGVVTPEPSLSPAKTPTASPSTNSQSSPSCEDVESFIDGKGRVRDCQWAVANLKCGKFADVCPVSCNACPQASTAAGVEVSGQSLLETAEQVVTACSEVSLSVDMTECQELCHGKLCCFDTGEFSCVEDDTKNCAAYVGCEALIGFTEQ